MLPYGMFPGLIGGGLIPPKFIKAGFVGMKPGPSGGGLIIPPIWNGGGGD